MEVYKHILYATDLHDSSKNVADRAKALADLHSAKLSIIHTIEPIPAYGYPGVTEMQSPIIEFAKTSLIALGKELNVPPENQIIEFGGVKTQVLAAATALNVDLIIIGSHGRHGISKLLGSSANGVVNAAKCDVIVIRCSDA